MSLTFGCADSATVDTLRAAGSTGGVQAVTAGVDALVVQEMEPGATGGSSTTARPTPPGGELPRLVAVEVKLPPLAAGGIMDGAGVAGVGGRGDRWAPRS